MNVAVVGASRDPTKFGNKAVRAYRMKGHDVYPVNPNEDYVEGLKCCGSVKEVPVELDLALLYVPPSAGVGVLEDIKEKWACRVIVNPGAGSPVLYGRARELGLVFTAGCGIRAAGADPDKL